MTEQSQPGRELDVLMWKVLERRVYDFTINDYDEDFEPEYPCMFLGEHKYVVYTSNFRNNVGTDWRPSTDIRHAFKVDREGWRWDINEERAGNETEARLRFTLITASFDIYFGIVFWHEAPDKPAAYALALCRAVAAWWEAQP